MSELKRRIRISIRQARLVRTAGWRRSESAYWLNRAGELRRSAFYIYGSGSR